MAKGLSTDEIPTVYQPPRCRGKRPRKPPTPLPPLNLEYLQGLFSVPPKQTESPPGEKEK